MNCRALLSCGLAMLVTLGCDARLNPRDRFPVGMCDITKPDELLRLKESGFDSFQTGTEDRHLLRQMAKEAQRLGMTMLLRPGHPQANEFGSNGNSLILDWVLSPNKPLETIAATIDKSTGDASRGQALWVALHLNDGPGRRPTSPQFNEIRFISYLAIAHGAKGIFYSTKRGGKILLDVPEEFQSIYRVAWELSGLKPVIASGRPITLPFNLKDGGPEAIAWRYRFRDYIIILNPRGNAMVKMPEVLLGPRWRPLFEARRDVHDLLTGAKGAWYLAPYRVIVLESDLKP